jgi:hypothetical protein
MPSSGQILQEYMVVYDCGRALAAAVVAVTVAVRDDIGTTLALPVSRASLGYEPHEQISGVPFGLWKVRSPR